MAGRYRAFKAWFGSTFEPLRPIYDAWMALIAGFNWVLVRLVLVVLFPTVFLLYGIVLRISGKDPMRRTLEPESDSYWESNTINNDSLSKFGRQY